MDREAAVNEVMAALRAAGEADYVGEPVSQLEHALQAGALALAAGAPVFEAVAALVHDLGHLDRVAPETCARMVEAGALLGVVGHEGIGADWLDGLGFDPRVGELVRAHVDAKRYLVATRPAYAARLSEASRQTLALQGGPMDTGEVARFEADPLLEAKLRVRSWDERAKDPDAVVPALEDWAPRLRDCWAGRS